MQQDLLKRAKSSMPGGVNSPVRAFGAVGGEPVFIRSAKGPYITDINGNQYVDFVGSWGPLILGHAHPRVVEAIKKAAELGTSFGASTEGEVELAEAICNRFDSVEKVRLVNSGTEAAMSAIRLARGATKKDKILKFRGCYHGHADSFLIQAGSGAMTFGEPSSPGVTKGTAADTLLADYNNLESVEKILLENKNQVAAIIVEPVAGNMGVIPPNQDFLPGLRKLCNENNALLVFDEVITGFRLSRGGAQQKFKVLPDLTIMGKVVGGGLPVGAFGGKADIMDLLSPDGPVYQAGTLSGNPLAVAAGLAVIHELDQKGFYSQLEEKAEVWEKELRSIFGDFSQPWSINRAGSMLTIFFNETNPGNYESAASSDTKMYGSFFHAALKNGIYLAPSQFEAAFVSAAHDEEAMEKAMDGLKKALREIREIREIS